MNRNRPLVNWTKPNQIQPHWIKQNEPKQTTSEPNKTEPNQIESHWIKQNEPNGTKLNQIDLFLNCVKF